MQGAQILRNEAYFLVRRSDEGCSATPQMGFLQSRQIKEDICMPEPIEGAIVGKGLKFGIVVSRFNDFITSRLLAGALDAFKQCDVDDGNITVVRVPGSFEIPMVTKKMAMSDK